MILKKLTPWILSSACALLFAVGATPVGLAADRLFVALRFSVLLFLSVLVVRQNFRPKPRHQNSVNPDRGDILLDTLTRWFRGETNPH